MRDMEPIDPPPPDNPVPRRPNGGEDMNSEEYKKALDAMAAGFGGMMQEVANRPEVRAKASAIAARFPVGTLIHVRDESVFNEAGDVGVVVWDLGLPPGGIGVMLKSCRYGTYGPLEIAELGVTALTWPTEHAALPFDCAALGIMDTLRMVKLGFFNSIFSKAEEIVAQQMRGRC